MPTETWYVMEDGSAADPRDVSPDAAGILRHKDGRAVAYLPHGPRSRSIERDEENAKGKSKSRDMKPEDPKKPYKTREAKAE